MWLGPMLDPGLVRNLARVGTPSDAAGLAAWLARLNEEVAVDTPFFYEPNTLAGELHLREPPSLERLMARLIDAGFPCARTTTRVGAFRTKAAYEQVVQAVRAVTA